MGNLHCITLFALVLNFFALVLHILHSFLSQSESSNFVMYIINTIKHFEPFKRYFAFLCNETTSKFILKRIIQSCSRRFTRIGK